VESPDYLHRVGTLLKIPAAMYFASFEPLLADFSKYQWEGFLQWPDKANLDWVIVGPETGLKHRPCKIEWIEHIVEQCQDAGTPVFVKALPVLATCERCGANIFQDEPHCPACEEPCMGIKSTKISKDMSEWPPNLRLRQMPKGWGNDDH
jgi:hypothetical protein